MKHYTSDIADSQWILLQGILSDNHKIKHDHRSTVIPTWAVGFFLIVMVSYTRKEKLLIKLSLKSNYDHR